MRWGDRLARIGWGITGAGHFLLDTFEVMEGLAKEHEVSCFLSPAGEQVVEIYGLMKKLGEICPGDYYRELITESSEGSASPTMGRFSRGAYDVLVVSPASANTVAKVVLGISDTLVTNAIAQAGKGGVPILVVPTDQKLGKTKMKLPCFIDRSACRGCGECPLVNRCPTKAVVFFEALGFSRIDLPRCVGCGACLSGCPRGAVSFGKEISVTIRQIDAENVEKLRRMPGFRVLREPREIPRALGGVLVAQGNVGNR